MKKNTLYYLAFFLKKIKKIIFIFCMYYEFNNKFIKATRAYLNFKNNKKIYLFISNIENYKLIHKIFSILKEIKCKNHV